MHNGDTAGKATRKLPGRPQCIKVIKPVGIAGRPAVYCPKPSMPGSRYCEDHQ